MTNGKIQICFFFFLLKSDLQPLRNRVFIVTCGSIRIFKTNSSTYYNRINKVHPNIFLFHISILCCVNLIFHFFFLTIINKTYYYTDFQHLKCGYNTNSYYHITSLFKYNILDGYFILVF